ncbi:MAG: phosphoribosylformylglycinamidine synthase [Lachnospiraceae bacterium]|nr:phosphoribosylformylglycinamidine synthase [Lachnospiraceae bacterium]
MTQVKRIYVEKKPEYAVAAQDLLNDIHSYLNIQSVTGVRVLIRYDIENITDTTYDSAKVIVFSEPPVDILYEENLPKTEDEKVFSVEYLPGQFDQRADSAEQCVKLLNETEEPIIRSATTYLLKGNVTEEELERIKAFCINPVDSRETSQEKPETLVQNFEDPADVAVFDNFRDMPEAELKALYDSLGLAMTFNDFKFIQEYYVSDEKRNPTVTEIRVLDTYWSDHCRHTTFQTELKTIEIEDGYYQKPVKDTYDMYMAHREEIFKGRKDKFVCLMDVALMAMRKLKKDGKMTDQEETDEINACSIIVPVEIDGQTEEWLINFKNETHNHPTEIEPFGGAATCLGGAIRDPLSGRTYVYQAMRVTGAADPRTSIKDTMAGKLPQRKLVTEAAHGYSSYGNQIGLATGLVNEIYHPNYAAKRMEIGAVMAAAPRSNVTRATSDPGDVIILLGGRTGRDGCGGATGSSKAHTEESIDTCGAEVQKGNAPTERKLQRLFRNPEVSRLIKKCNDFGAGGVSVAIGELAVGLKINLDTVPKKYAGLDGTELAISESQERMAVVIDPKDVDAFMEHAAKENLEATCVAEVTESPRLVMQWRGKTIVDISRAFLDTNGAHQENNAYVTLPNPEDNYFKKEKDVTDMKKAWLSNLSDLNVCSQKGLVEMFDSSIGASSVYMPYGGKYQLTPAQSMIAKIPVLKGKCDTVTMMSYGFDPYLSTWSPYHGAIYAVVQSVAKIVAAGGDLDKIHFTFQEYFRRMTDDPKTWGEPLSALLGAYNAQIGFGLASIGGKDSMSGSFNEMNVPPTLVSFAVDVAKQQDIVSSELKAVGNKLVVFSVKKDEYDLPDYEQMLDMYRNITKMVNDGVLKSTYTVGFGGIAEAVSKMAFGNKLGVAMNDNMAAAELFKPYYGDIVAEVAPEDLDKVTAAYTVCGTITEASEFTYKDMKVSMDEALAAWTQTLEEVFPTKSGVEEKKIETGLYTAKDIYICKHKVAKPKVFIPVFPGTNCEYDTMKAFEKAGADVEMRVFRNLNEGMIRDSVDEYVKAINNAQILMFPGGFSAGDEPDGSAKFIASVFRNEKIKEAVNQLLNQRDGLALGICNGFQALIKLGLVPYGEITPQKEDSPTLTTNHIGRHISKMVYTKVVTNKSPWLQKVTPGDVFAIPASHGEGRFVANEEWIKKLFETGCVATQYVDVNGNPTMDEDFNPNGSYFAIEGITSPDGRVLGKMAHSERIGDHVAMNITGNQNQHLFESGVEYFK